MEVTLGIDACAEVWPFPLTCYGGIDLITFESQTSYVPPSLCVHGNLQDTTWSYCPCCRVENKPAL